MEKKVRAVFAVVGTLFMVVTVLWFILDRPRGLRHPYPIFSNLRSTVAVYGAPLVVELVLQGLPPGEHKFGGYEAMELVGKQVPRVLESEGARGYFFDQWGEEIIFMFAVREESGQLEYELTLRSKGPNRRDDSGAGDDVVYGPTRYKIWTNGYPSPELIELPPSYSKWKEERRRQRRR